MRSYKDVKNKFLQDKEVKKVYNELGPEFELVRMIIKKRLESGLTQKELAEKIGTKQSAISRLEKGDYNPSLSFLHRLAEALDTKIHISFKDKVGS